MPLKSLVILSCQTDRLGTVSPCCAKRDAAAVHDALLSAIQAEGLPVTVESSPCLGMCSVGPNLRIVGDAVFNHMMPEGLAPVLQRVRELLKQGVRDGMEKDADTSLKASV